MSVPLWRFSQCVVEGCPASRNGVLSLFLPGVAGRGHCFYTSEPVVCVLMAFSTPNLNIKNVPGCTQACTLAVLETTFSCVVHPLRSASLLRNAAVIF